MDQNSSCQWTIIYHTIYQLTPNMHPCNIWSKTSNVVKGFGWQRGTMISLKISTYYYLGAATGDLGLKSGRTIGGAHGSLWAGLIINVYPHTYPQIRWVVSWWISRNTSKKNAKTCRLTGYMNKVMGEKHASSCAQLHE